MSKYIRWKGLLAFLVVTLIICAFWFLLVDTIVKRTIEKYGTTAVGARVNVATADLSLIPSGLELIGLQITNPDEPMKNAVEISRLHMAFDAVPLLRRKIIVKDMTVDGVQFNTPRKKSGAIKKTSRKDVGSLESQSGPGKTLSYKDLLPAFEIPSLKKILEKEDLKSLKLINTFRNDAQAEQGKWKQILKELPSKSKFEEYSSRIKKLKSSQKGSIGGLLGSAGDMATLQKEIQRDLDRIKKAADDLQGQLATFEKRFNQLSKAPMQDFMRLKKKYSISPKGLANMSRLLFGPKINQWVEQARAWHERLKPVLQRSLNKEKGPDIIKPIRGKGVNVRFKEQEPLPDFLIRRVKTNMRVDAGNFTGNIKNITPDQDILGLPLTFAFSGENMKKLHSLKIDGFSDYINPSRPKNRLNLAARKLSLSNLTLSDASDFPVTLSKATANVNLQAFLKGDAISSDINAAFKAINLSSTPPEGAGPVVKAMNSALTGIKRLNAQININGTIEDYQINVKSDLDRILQSAAGNLIQKEIKKFDTKLKKAVLGKTNGPLNGAKQSLGGLSGIEGELNKRLKIGEGALGGGMKLPF
jgi:uncharacterized protein (TIGR03545 family)